MTALDRDQTDEPRGRLLGKDAAILSEAELLAIVFQRGTRFESAVQMSGRLLTSFGGLRQLLQADLHRLTSEQGIGKGRLAVLKAIEELARRYFEQTLPVGQAIQSPSDTEAFLLARLRDLPHELFCCLFLDNRHRILKFEELFRGTIDGTSVYPREVVKQALAVNAAAVILAHNRCLHPNYLFL